MQRRPSCQATAPVVPEPHILPTVAKIYDLQLVEKQMSKSIGGNGVLWMLDEPKVLEKKIKSAVTDTGREIVYDPATKPGVSNLLAILAAVGAGTVDELEKQFTDRGYGDLKKAVAEAVVAVCTPYREQVQGYLADPAELDNILARGADRAREVAAQTLTDVYDRIGFLPGRPRR